MVYPEEIETQGFIEAEPALGFHRPNSFNKVLNLDECHLQNDLSNDIRNHLRDFVLKTNFILQSLYP